MNGIKNSWSLLSFARSHGKMHLADFTNGKTGDTYKGIAFINPETNSTCFVNFSSKTGPMSGSEILANKDNLQVCELNVADDVLAARKADGRQLESYCLCMKGQNAWEEVDLGL